MLWLNDGTRALGRKAKSLRKSQCSSIIVLFEIPCTACQMKSPDPIEKVRVSTASKAPVFPHPMHRRQEPVSVRLMLAFLICILGCSQLQAQPRDRTLFGKVTTWSGTPEIGRASCRER